MVSPFLVIVPHTTVTSRTVSAFPGTCLSSVLVNSYYLIFTHFLDGVTRADPSPAPFLMTPLSLRLLKLHNIQLPHPLPFPSSTPPHL